MIQARRNRKVTSDNRTLVGAGLREILFIFFCFASLYLFISLASYNPLDPGWFHTGGDVQEVSNKGGLAGAVFADVFLYLFGYFAYLFAFMVGYLGWLIYQGRHHDLLEEPRHLIVPGIGFLLTLSAGCGLAIVHFTAESALLPSHAGGILGTFVGKNLESVFSPLGATLLLLALFFTGITLLTGLSWLKLMDRLGLHTLRLLPVLEVYLRRRLLPRLARYLGFAWDKLAYFTETGARLTARFTGRQWQDLQARYAERRRRRETQNNEEYVEDDEYYGKAEEHQTEAAAAQAPAKPEPPVITEIVRPAPRAEGGGAAPGLRKEELLPSVACLEDAPPASPPPDTETAALLQKVRKSLQHLASDAEVKNAYPGPVVTRVEIQPGKDHTTAQVLELSEKLAAALEPPKVRVVEAVPAMLSLEVPNAQPQAISLGGLFSGDAYSETPSPLTLALGRDGGGQPVIVDLARMPHLLLAGHAQEEVDQVLHSLILSLLYKATADELRFILVDVSRAALTVYADLPHLLTPIVTRLPQVEQSFRWCVAEMERRYRLMADLGVRNIDGYNRKVKASAQQENLDRIPLKLSPIPYIVAVVHEIADITGGQHRAIEEAVTRLAQKARAAGIHMVLASRQPTVNVITGLMKTNFPTRIALQVPGKAESRNILGQHGAETLLGQGDMLFLTPGTALPARVHGPHVSMQEVKSVLGELKKQAFPGYADLSVAE